MRKRNIRLQFWVNEKELEQLNRRVKRSMLSRQAYFRQLIAGLVPQDAPPPDYHAMMQEMYEVRNTLQYLLHEAKTQGLSTDKIEDSTTRLDDTIQKISQEILEPKRMS